MEKIRLGRTGLMVSRSGFGAIPIQRISAAEAGRLLRKACENGINFFDTARSYTDSEEKIGLALADVRGKILLATKGKGESRKKVLEDLETSLRLLRTDYVDLLQIHNLKKTLDREEPDGAYQGLLEAREKGMTRFIGMSTHRLDIALEAAASGLYDTVQFPLSMISSKKDLTLIGACRDRDIGLIAMKALSGGLITNAAAAFAFMRQFDTLVPIWGIQRERELDEFIALEANPPVLDDAMRRVIEKDRAELAGDFCRGCGYCLPCPAVIPIAQAARMSLLLRRTLVQRFLTDQWKADMAKIRDCQECGHCREQCPYELDTPAILKKMLADYEAFLERRS
ncbi:MAG: aldo/keto reductase [Proteobacteria bacterium]|nr:aldo/keto reductase [Pseudomonadota bacterium]